DFFITGVGRTGCARASASQRADGGAFASAGEATDERAYACPTAHQNSGAFTFTLGGLCQDRGANRELLPINGNGVQLQREERTTSEVSHRLGIHNLSFNPRARRNNLLPIHQNGP